MDTAILRTFLAILDEGSFAAAARRMGISKSLCSKHIADLEADLGVRLLTRTTRTVTATSVGLLFGERLRESRAILDTATEDALLSGLYAGVETGLRGAFSPATGPGFRTVPPGGPAWPEPARQAPRNRD